MEHICCSPDCNEIKLYGSQYCHIHMCNFREGEQYCTNKCIDNCIYCEEHQNTHVYKNMCDYEDCENIKQYGSRYCFEHICQYPTCVNHHKTKCHRIYCNDHRCSVSKCETMRQDDSIVCENHECKFENCRNPLRYFYDTFCQIHVCKICDDCRCELSEYCEKHKCKYAGCMTKCNCDDDYRDSCELHMCCEEKCFRVVVTNGKYCKYHTCRHIGCVMRILNMPYGSYCEEHSCEMPGCNGEIMKGMKMCKEHICCVQDCKKTIFTGRVFKSPKFCDMHMCQYVEHPCDMRCDERILDGKKYCSEHKCCICDEQIKQYRAKGCELHTCHNKSCDRVVFTGSEFCEHHRCFGCGKEKDWWYPSCGPDCTDEIYAFMYRVCKLFAKHECEVFLKDMQIYAQWYFSYESNFHKMNIMGRDIYVCENMEICEVSGCGNPTLFSSKCNNHNEDKNE